jgi:hypothetical protein
VTGVQTCALPIWYVKNKAFSTPVPDITNLKARITDAFATITVGEHVGRN